MNRILRIALTGPESTGKTTLCIRLAERFQTVWVPEFSREYIATLGRAYTHADVLYCIQKQIEIEDAAALDANGILFSDTELINAREWLIDVFGDYPSWIDEQIIARKYDLHLLLLPDIDFIPDPVRENPCRREYFFGRYKSELDRLGFRYVIIGGSGDERFRKSIEAVERLLLENVSD